jgi:hypothetical protein
VEARFAADAAAMDRKANDSLLANGHRGSLSHVRTDVAGARPQQLEYQSKQWQLLDCTDSALVLPVAAIVCPAHILVYIAVDDHSDDHKEESHLAVLPGGRPDDGSTEANALETRVLRQPDFRVVGALAGTHTSPSKTKHGSACCTPTCALMQH